MCCLALIDFPRYVFPTKSHRIVEKTGLDQQLVSEYGRGLGHACYYLFVSGMCPSSAEAFKLAMICLIVIGTCLTHRIPDVHWYLRPNVWT